MVGPLADLRPLNITIRVIPAMSEGSPWPRCWSPGRNQFQPVEALAVAGCSGYATRKMHSSAIVFMRVPAAKLSADWMLPCQHDDQRERLPL